jgi:hypothetical protein
MCLPPNEIHMGHEERVCMLLTSATIGAKWSRSQYSDLTSTEGGPSTQWPGGWAGLKPSLNMDVNMQQMKALHSKCIAVYHVPIYCVYRLKYN